MPNIKSIKYLPWGKLWARIPNALKIILASWALGILGFVLLPILLVAWWEEKHTEPGLLSEAINEGMRQGGKDMDY